jgi:hypothetical protein
MLSRINPGQGATAEAEAAGPRGIDGQGSARRGPRPAREPERPTPPRPSHREPPKPSLGL